MTKEIPMTNAQMAEFDLGVKRGSFGKVFGHSGLDIH